MNAPDSTNIFKPKQALAPTPQLYDDLVGDGMEALAKATVADMLPIPSGAVILDNGCGTGAGTVALVAALGDMANVQIKGLDINEDALTVYQRNISAHHWPAEAIHGDANALPMPDATFSHCIATAMVFVLPDDSIPAMKEIYRTLKPGGLAAANAWFYNPNLLPIRVASQRTRPEGTTWPRGGLQKWADPDLLRRVLESGGFDRDQITLSRRDVYFTTTTDLHRYATMLWSFIGGTSSVGWLESDEERWDEAVDIVKEELRKSDEYQELEGGGLRLKFVANIAIARK